MYKHTQIGKVTIFVLGILFLIFLFGSLRSGDVAGLLVAGIMLLAILLLATLTVEVAEDYIKVIFGIGLIRMRIKISEVISSGIVKNQWWYGFGIHGWWGKGWLLNVSGLDAVELKMKNGMVYRLGTDEPQKLNAAIQTKIKQR